MVNLEYIFTSNDKFSVGDIVTIGENGGAGVATATVASIHEGQRLTLSPSDRLQHRQPLRSFRRLWCCCLLGYSINLCHTARRRPRRYYYDLC